MRRPEELYRGIIAATWILRNIDRDLRRRYNLEHEEIGRDLNAAVCYRRKMNRNRSGQWPMIDATVVSPPRNRYNGADT